MLNASIYAQIHATLSGLPALGTEVYDLEPTSNVETTFQSGTGAGQADKLFVDHRTLAASTSENLDLAGVLVDPLGAALTFVTVKAILIRAAAANTNDVLVGGAASNTFIGVFNDPTDIVKVKPGGAFLWVAPNTGAPVTPSTGDLLKVANGGAGTVVVYDVVLIGTSA